MAQFLLFLYENPTVWDGLSPESQQTAVGRYMEWGKKPYVTPGQRLTPDPGKVMRVNDGKTLATDGPYSETKEVLAGFYSIEAADYDQAVKLAADHPHLDFGTIEIRQVWNM